MNFLVSDWHENSDSIQHTVNKIYTGGTQFFPTEEE